MASYVAIDFETANERRDSPCSIGVVRVEDGAITEHWTTLINPEQPFAGMNIGIHGIRSSDVVDAPLFPEVLEKLLRTCEDSEALVAHSAAFDTQVLAAAAGRYQANFGELAFACTRVFSRHWFPGWASYSLGHIADQLGLAEMLGGDRHHDALWDASAAMLIAEHGLQQNDHKTWDDAARAVHVRLGSIRPADYNGCVTSPSDRKSPLVPRTIDDLDPDHPLFGMRVCFTGALSRYTRHEAAQAVVDAGGEFSDSVTKKTNLLVVGTQDMARLNGQDQSSKLRRAVELAAARHPIEVIEEGEFYRLLAH